MVEDMPVGGGGGDNPFGAASSMAEEQPPSQPAANADDDKPLDERLVSKTWAVRKTAFEELTAIIVKFEPGTNNEVMNEHSSKWPKYLVEPNPGALEKVLECFHAYIDKCDPAILTAVQDKIYLPILDKGLGAAKPNLKAKAMECMLMYFEVSENFGDETLDALQAQVKSAKPKIALCAFQLLAALMLAFGIKRFSPAKFGKQIEAGANSSAPASRTEAMNCYKAIFQWVGEAGVGPFIEKLKEAQKTQLKKDFEAITAEKKQFKRKTRTEAEAARQAAVDNAVNAAMEEETKEEKIDVFDISAPKEILSKFGPDWATATLAIKKWNEKKEAIDKVIAEADTPKLQPGDYSGLFEVLKKLAGDAHSTVAQYAIKAIGLLAKGLRAEFHDLALQAIPACFAKLKEKRQGVIDEIQQTLENIMMCIQFNEIIEKLQGAIKAEKLPLAKQHIAVFIERSIRATYIDELEDIAEQLAAMAVSFSDEKDGNLRDQGLVVIGVLFARVPIPMQKYVDPLPAVKKEKINTAKETVKISKYDKSEKKAAAAAAAAKKKQAAAKPASKPASKPKAAVMTFDNDQAMADESMGAASDNVLNEVAPPKPKGPALSKKPVAKKVSAAEDGDALAQPDAPKKGPPARLAARAAAAPSGPIKVIKAEDIQEEDIGSGMGKDTAIEKVGAFYDAGHVAKFEEAKWQDKQAGFVGLKEQIEALKPDKTMVEATAKFVKAKMKDWKESNIVMMKEAVSVLLVMTQQCEDIPKRAVACYTPFLCEKIGDIKMNGPIKEELLNCAEFCTAKWISVQMVKKGLTTKAPNNIKETCNFIAQLISEFGAGRVAIKECIDFAVFSANHANKQVRDAAMALFSEIYKHLGEKTNQFLDGVKPATMALIEKEFEKVTPYAKGEFECTRSVKGEAAEVEQAAGPSGKGEPDALAALESALPRADISKQLTPKLIKMFTESDWKLKVKGCEAVQTILRESQMRIQPDGLQELMDQLKNNYKASNKAVIKQVILLMGAMAEATGPPILTYNKRNLKPLLAFLGDKAALMRADVISTTNKWSEAIGAEHIINNMCTYLTDGNPEMRNDSLKWICANKAAIVNCEHATMVKPLIMCLNDKSGPIRTMADEAIVTVMGHIGFSPFQEGIRDLKPAVQQTVRPLLEKAKQKAIAANPDAAGMDDDADDPKGAAASGPTKKVVAKSGTAAASRNTTKAVSKTMNASASAKGGDEEMKSSPSKPQNSFAVASTRKSAISKTTKPASAPAQDEGEAFSVNPGNKERRALADSKSKWVHDDVKPAHLNACKKHSEEIFGMDVSTLMWSADFKKHLQVIEKMLGLINTQPQDLMECVDVIFKWTSVKLGESNNTAFQSSVYDFYAKLFEFLISQSYLFWEHEADVVIPLLCEKVGNNNAILRQKVKALIKQVFNMNDPKKTLLLLIKFGANNKNLKSAGEALDEIAIYLQQIQSVPFGEQQIKIIAKLVDNKDPNVRENSLCCLSEIYKVLDEDIWRVVGNVPLKVKGLLEQRFRKVKGLGSSTSASTLNIRNTTKATPAKASPRRPAQKEELTKSFNPGLKSQNATITPRAQGLNFQKTESASSGQQNLTKSFRPSTAANQSNLTRSFGNRDGVKAFNAQRPQTAVNAFQQPQSQQNLRFKPSQNPDISGGHQDDAKVMEALDFHPPQQNNEMHFMDDDEDLRQQIEEMEGPRKEELDPTTQRQVDDMMKHISNLKYSSDLNKRVESLIALNEIIQAIQSHEKAIQHTANDLISAFTHVLIDIFERPRQDTPLRFAKYFVTIVNKTCQCSIIMSVVREQELYELGEQLLTRLLIDNLDKLGDEKEGEFILKNLNGSMLRCLENCNKTSIFCVLFNLLRRYKDNPAQLKLPGLIIKCLLKLSKILEKVISELEIERVLIVIHLYLISINHEKKTSNDEMGIRIVKTLVHEMVKIKQHSILQSYKVVENHEVEDKHLHRWIKIILNTIDPNESSQAAGSDPKAQEAQANQEIVHIIAELKSTDTFQTAIPKLHNFLTKYSFASLEFHIRELSSSLQAMIRTNLEQYRNQLSDSGSTPNGNSQNMPINPQDRPSFAAQDQRRFGASSTKVGSTTALGQPTGGFSQTAQGVANSGGTSSQTRIGGFNSRQSVGQEVQRNTESSSDRMNTYQSKLSKLSSMREKFQQRKTLTGTTPTQTAQQKAASINQGSAASNKNNLSTSFSALNNSLQMRWQAAQKKDGGTARNSITGEAQAQMSSTMAPRASVPGNRASETTGGEPGQASGASNQDLNKRLLELKGKLAALKKP